MACETPLPDESATDELVIYVRQQVKMNHIPVLKKEVIEYLNPQPDQNFIDCTVGGGGHTEAILEKTGPKGKVLGIDWDLEQIEASKLRLENFKERFLAVCDNFANIAHCVDEYQFEPVNGILIDLGASSWHFDRSKKGFSFMRDEPLDMRYSFDNVLTAKEILNNWKEEELEKIFREYGEEKFSARISAEIADSRAKYPFEKTFDLVQAIKRAVPEQYLHQEIHFATRTFQALRIAVNGELENLNKVLPQALAILAQNGRLAVISFHSLEDRIVKNFFNENKANLNILTKKPVVPSQSEIKNNHSARSAKLRVAQKL